MEAGESGARQSAIPTVSNFDHLDHRSRERIDRPYSDAPAMATAALMNPNAPPYHPHSHSHSHSHSLSHSHAHHPSFSYPHPAPSVSIPAMISPVDSRRTSGDSESPHRQSLPSIQEVISGTKQAAFAPPTPSQTSLPPSQGLPSPFASSAPSRSFGDVAMDKNPSPRTLHPTSSFSRSETLPAFSDPARPALSSRPAPPPLNTFSSQHPSPPLKFEQMEPEQRHEREQLSAGYQLHTPTQPTSGLYSQTGRLPPGQLPLAAFPVSPRHTGPTLPSPYESHRPPMYSDDGEYGPNRGSEYKVTLERHFEAWSYVDSLHTVACASRTVFGFSEAHLAAAREQQGSQPIPSRLPTEAEVTHVLENTAMITKKLEEIREMIRHNTEQARENGGGRKGFDDEDSSMYGDGLKQSYSITEVKKRRGVGHPNEYTPLASARHSHLKQRAAPPGRCHSCNRIDTPEWRRGPDGARTLCNACGLHYAKLERKRQLEQRSIRPKNSDDRN
ncbi:hypothetical protein B0T22DRAFT_227892 [Podospora appendiculata]|uniref:GATA-type domain-containing protein n=1 Tax=Podospora appendiculata TaxID=314037 RepID=A0AAE1CAN2_9PEZI|nr:hypothetical protein B0T22DRAFT_227892 [Podospora appendiculata]